MNDQRPRPQPPRTAPAPQQALAPVPRHVAAFQAFMADVEQNMLPEITRGLKQQAKEVDPRYWVDLVYSLIKETPDILDCEPASVRYGITTAARLGLMLDKHSGHAYLVPYTDKRRGKIAQFIIGYKGLVALAHRSPKIKRIVARPVYAGDDFDYSYGLVEHLHHKPNLSSRQGRELAYVYAVCHLADGDTQFVVMDRSEIERIRARSKASGGSSPWSTDFVPMAMKTAVRNLARWLPLDGPALQAIAADEAADLVDAPEFRESEPVSSHDFAAALAAQMAPPEKEEPQAPREIEADSGDDSPAFIDEDGQAYEPADPEPELALPPPPKATTKAKARVLSADAPDPIASMFPDGVQRPIDPERRR